MDNDRERKKQRTRNNNDYQQYFNLTRRGKRKNRRTTRQRLSDGKAALKPRESQKNSKEQRILIIRPWHTTRRKKDKSRRTKE
ncbi:hypothetical protein AVEN_119332-1 [Araneus ventricosus]|uniref:Uncharacterized protein n=1 Tax=Araneus ventricosus TaxID=182803 RepID=A0A4Y2TML8_ARAVE|nr:hypothetical protein AVEN_119332-1 [Araneus ventricosus]